MKGKPLKGKSGDTTPDIGLVERREGVAKEKKGGIRNCDRCQGGTSKQKKKNEKSELEKDAKYKYKR